MSDLVLIKDSPKYLEMDHFKEYEGEIFCFRESCEGCQFQNECDFEEKSLNISDHPNLRKAFIAHDGYLIFAMDYSGIELRVCAILSEEPQWVSEFQKPPTCPTHGDRSVQYHLNSKCSICGEKLKKADLHTKTAQLIYPDFNTKDYVFQKAKRQIGKTCNFGLLYGGTKYTLSKASQGALDVDEAEIVKNAFFANLKGIRAWHKNEEFSITRNLKATTLFERVRPIPDGGSNDFRLRNRAVRTGWNHEVQGTAADIMKMAMVRVNSLIEKNGWDDVCRLMLTVHDELVFEIREDFVETIVPAVADTMLLKDIGVKWLVPFEIDVEYDYSWDASNRFTGTPWKPKSKPVEKNIPKNTEIISETLVYTFNVPYTLDMGRLHKLNDAITNSKGNYELRLKLLDGSELKIENRKVNPEVFNTNFQK